MLDYYVQWHLRQALAPMLFDDEYPLAGEAQRDSIIAPAQRSEAALAKAAHTRTAEDEPVHSFQSLLSDLASIANNQVMPCIPDAQPFELITRPTALRQRALNLLNVKL